MWALVGGCWSRVQPWTGSGDQRSIQAELQARSLANASPRHHPRRSRSCLGCILHQPAPCRMTLAFSSAPLRETKDQLVSGTHALNDQLEARIVPNRVKHRVSVQRNHRKGAHLIRLFQTGSQRHSHSPGRSERLAVMTGQTYLSVSAGRSCSRNLEGVVRSSGKAVDLAPVGSW